MSEIRLRATGEVITEQDYRNLHPLVAFATTLAPEMLLLPDVEAADLVLPVDPPEADDTLDVLRDGVEQLEDGTWCQKWKTQAKPARQVASQLFALVSQLSDDIDNRVAAVYETSQRFSQEYLRRETQARAYLQACDAAEGANQSAPPAPRLIADFALTTDISNKEAAQLTLNQAAAMYTLLEHLGGLRMRKNEIKRAATAAAARAIHQEVIEAITAATT